MSKTASLIVRILALLAAIGAGVGFYFIYEQNFKLAMAQTDWLKSDPEIKSGPEFVDRMNVMQPKLPDLLNAKRREIIAHLKTIEERDATIVARDKTIAERDATIDGLVTDKANLTRELAETNGKLAAANAKGVELQASLDEATRTIAQKNEQIQNMYTKEQYDEQVKLYNEAVDKHQSVVGKYTKFWNWTKEQVGFTPPFPRVPMDKSDDAKVKAPEVKMAEPRIATKITAVDPMKGILTISLGAENANIAKGQIYEVELDGVSVGNIRITDVSFGYAVANILSGSNRHVLAKNVVVNLVRSRAVAGAANRVAAEAPGGGATITQPAAPVEAVPTPPAP